MSRYPPPEYRGIPRDRSRSPLRFGDRRASAASIFDSRPAGPPRTASEAPRGPRSQYDGPRPPLPSASGSLSGPRPTYTSLRDAPPLGSGDRGRPYREREYDRRDRPPSRERSPARTFKDSRDYLPRDLDIGRARRESRDGPPPAGSTYSEGAPPVPAPFRGGFSRGPGRGDIGFKSGRGGRSNLDERDLFRRERSPPRWGARDVPRDGRELDRRDDRRLERREDDRRPSDWTDRERDTERLRRDQPPPRLESRPSSESINSANATHQPSQAPPINPARLALIESTGADPSVRRPSVQQDAPPQRDPKREQPETPSYLNGRAETTANRYGSRGSSPPTQAPPVPAFTLSFAPTTAPSAPIAQSAPAARTSKSPHEPKAQVFTSGVPAQSSMKPVHELKREPPADAPIAPRAPPPAPKAQLVSPPLAAPRAPRALENEDAKFASNRLHGVRSLDNLPAQSVAPFGPSFPRPEMTGHPIRPTSLSPAVVPALPTLIEPVSPSQPSRFADLGAPTGPRATRMSPAQASVSPRPPFASPRSDFGGFQGTPGGLRMQTPPPSAPLGPKNRSYSVSPKVAPTAPKGGQVPPLAPRGPNRSPIITNRAPDRLGAPLPWAPPSAPRSLQWNQWRRPGAPASVDKAVPAKRDFSGEAKASGREQNSFSTYPNEDRPAMSKSEEVNPIAVGPPLRPERSFGEEIDMNTQPPRRQTLLMSGHSAAQSFFGKPVEKEDKDEEENDDTGMSDTAQEPLSTSEEEDSELEDGNLTLFHAKFERQKRQLEAQMVDLSTRPYRATTPLESIARLARISTKDLQRVNEQREHEMDVDDSPVTSTQNILLQTTHSSESGEGQDIVTPKGVDDHHVTIRSSDDSSEGTRRIRRPSPEPVILPYLLKDGREPYIDSETFQDRFRHFESSQNEIIDAIEEELVMQDDSERDLEVIFADDYQRWREECEALDGLKEEQEKLERQQSIEPGPEFDVPAMPLVLPFEGRRLHKFSSEYEIEQVLKQSEETARIEQERQDRETRKNQADMEKEARVPDQLTDDEVERSVFVDFNRYRNPELLPEVLSYEPPPDTLTENEQQIFVAAFKETPKKWGEIASLLPGRTYEDCIRHYYANKWDGRFRDNRTKKLKAGGRRGRGGARGPRGRVGGLMADMARIEELLSPESMSEKGRPRRAAAPTTFAEKEAEAKATLLGPSPGKKPGPAPRSDANDEPGPEKPGKRQKRTGEKPGRKTGKGNQPLANLAAAPPGSLTKPYLHGLVGKEDPARAQKLEEASLLANLQTGHHAVHNVDSQMVYSQDGLTQPVGGSEEPERSKVGGQGAPTTKQSASSYWSVPEQNDFVKYIGHFGRDFGAIAAHMGTKTQTMIKNHYQRQVDGGNRPELERAANEADERRARGEDMGPPPTPTPIIKRKYDNPQPAAPRALAPQSEGMEVDVPPSTSRVQAPKHTSPPQYQAQPRFSTSAQNTPIPATRVPPSPLPATATPVTSQPMGSANPRPLQHSLGNRFTFLSDSRSDSRPSVQPAPGFRTPQESPSRSQPAQSARSRPDAQDPQYLRNLVQEQERALLMQEQYSQQDRIEQHQRQNSQHQNPPQTSPPNPTLQQPPDRKPLIGERAPSPPRSNFPLSGIARTPFGSAFSQLGQTLFSPIGGRSVFNPSPIKREEPRPGSVPTKSSAQTPPASAPPSEPKRSNVMALLNNEDDAPKPPKRDSYPQPLQRASSPVPQSYHHTASAAPPSTTSSVRRVPSFGQPSLPQSHFQRDSFGPQTSAPAPPSLKHEPTSGGGSMSQAPKVDWAARVLGQSTQPSPTTPTLERDVRPYYQHTRSVLGSLNQTMGNPSPPPIIGIAHSRTPSLTAQSGQIGREQPRSGISGQQQSSTHQPAQSLQPNPFASHQPSVFSQQHPGQSQNQAHHSHNTSVGGPFPSFHQRTISRDDLMRQERALAEQREREEEMRYRQRDAERRREDERYTMQRRQQEEQERQQQALNRPPPQPLQPGAFGLPFGSSRGLDLRGQSKMETEMAIREEQERQRAQDMDRRHQDALMRERETDELRRRQGESFFQRTTPLGGSYGVPPPAPPRRQ